MEWQTCSTQNAVDASPCGFKSHLQHRVGKVKEIAMTEQKVLVVVGPTASGKSALAVKLAKKFNGEIISADSRQVYRGLNIGTGKITKKEMQGIRHHLLNVASLGKQFTAAQYRTLASKSLKSIVIRNKLPIVAGGTGLYIDALTGSISFPDVAPDKTLRNKLEKKSVEELFQILKKKDPHRAKTMDPKNKVRLVRALEIIEALGHVPNNRSAKSRPYEFVYIGLEPHHLDKKILLRIHHWLKNGLINEVRKLHAHGISWKRMGQIGLVYHTVVKYLRGKISRDEMIREMFMEIRQYAKRQMTWFERNKKIKWFRPDEFKKIREYVRMTVLGLPRVKSRGD